MDFGLDLSSRIEDRIDHDLFSDGSDDLSLPGTSRRVPGLASSHADASDAYSSFQSDSAPVHTLPRAHAPAPAANEHDSLAVDLDNLNERLLDDSHSLQLSTKDTAPSDESRFSLEDSASRAAHDTSTDGQFLQQHGSFSLRAARAHSAARAADASDPDSDSGSDSVLDSPTSHAASASPTLIQKRAAHADHSARTTPPESPSGHAPFAAAAELRASTGAASPASSASLPSRESLASPASLASSAPGSPHGAPDTAEPGLDTSPSRSAPDVALASSHASLEAERSAAPHEARTSTSPAYSPPLPMSADRSLRSDAEAPTRSLHGLSRTSDASRASRRLDVSRERSRRSADASYGALRAESRSGLSRSERSRELSRSELSRAQIPRELSRESLSRSELSRSGLSRSGRLPAEQYPAERSRGSAAEASQRSLRTRSSAGTSRSRASSAHTSRSSASHTSVSLPTADALEASWSTSRSPRAPSPASHTRSPESPPRRSASASLSDILTVPNVHANTSLPPMRDDADLVGSHVDPHRLIVYQDKLNRQLAEENEALKMQCDFYVQLLQAHRIPLDASDRSATSTSDASEDEAHTPPTPAAPGISTPTPVPAATPAPEAPKPSPAEAHLRRRIRDLEAIVDEQHRRLHAAPAQPAPTPPQSAPQPPTPQPPTPRADASSSVLERTTSALQDRHERLLADVAHALASGAGLHDAVEQLRAALNQAHGVINAMRPGAEAPRAADASGHTPRSQAAADTSARTPLHASTSSVHAASVSMDADEALEELGPLQHHARTLTSELHEARAALDEALAHARDSCVRKARLEEQLAATRTDLGAAQARLDEKAAALRTLHTGATPPRAAAALRDARADLDAARAQQQHMAQQQRILEEQLERAARRADDAGAAAEHARAARQACEAQLDAHIEQIEGLEHALALRNDEVAQLRGEKDHLWDERRAVLAQVHRFEQHLREVRSDTERYGADLAALRGARDAAADDALAAAAARADTLAERLHIETRRRRALVAQKAYVAQALHAHEWLVTQLGTRLTTLAPLLGKYGGAPPPRRRRTLRAAAWAVRAALFWGP